MHSRRFFSDSPPENGILQISGEESHHIKHVLRLKVGETIEVINGRGLLHTGEISGFFTRGIAVSIRETIQEPQPKTKIIIAPSLIKKRGLNILIEKLAELGIDEIRPVIFSRTDSDYGQGALKKWQKIAQQSLKVNKKKWVTGLYPPVSFNEIVAYSKNISTRIVLDVKGNTETISNIMLPVIAVIGPPGDFTTEELLCLKENGFSAYNINDGVLRTETAAIAIGTILKGAC